MHQLRIRIHNAVGVGQQQIVSNERSRTLVGVGLILLGKRDASDRRPRLALIRHGLAIVALAGGLSRFANNTPHRCRFLGIGGHTELQSAPLHRRRRLFPRLERCKAGGGMRRSLGNEMETRKTSDRQTNEPQIRSTHGRTPLQAIEQVAVANMPILKGSFPMPYRDYIFCNRPVAEIKRSRKFD